MIRTAHITTEQERQFSRLLAALILLYAGGPVISLLSHHGWSTTAELVALALLLLLLSASVQVSARSTRAALAIGALILAATVLQSLAWVKDDLRFLIGHHLLLLLILIPAILSLTRYLFGKRDSSIHTINASVCIYFLIAVLWASMYTLICLADPMSFDLPAYMEAAGRSFVNTIDGSSIALYYSLVTLTTLGYGDITPVNEFARMLSALEAVVGPFYLAIIVARLVGIYVREIKQTTRQP